MAPSASRYERLRAIASGGMATVYLGRAVGPGGFERLVAIKVMHPHIAQYSDFVSMFLDEARLAAGIHHPNVVAVHDVGVDDTGVFLVMDYVEGASLDKVLKSLGPGSKLPIGVSLRIVIDMLSGLHAAHILATPDGTPLNLVHRDVSPQNILVGVDGITRITDFGIARAESRLAEHTDTGKVKGKYAYMSIEQIHGRPYDLRSDVYSVGIVLWELLSGLRLYPGDNDGAVAYAAAAGPVQSPRDVNDNVPAELDDIVMRALCRSPEDRFPSAMAFTEAIEDWSTRSGIPISKPREVADFLARMDDDGPTRIKPQSAADLIAMIEQRGPPPGFRLPEDSTTDDVKTGLIRPDPNAITPPDGGPLAPGLAAGGGTVEISYMPQGHLTVEMQTEPLRSEELPEIDSLVIPPKPEQPITSGTLLTFTEPAPAPGRRALGRAALAAGMMALVVFAAFKVLFPDESPATPELGAPRPSGAPASTPNSNSPPATATPQPRVTRADAPATATPPTAEATAKPAPTPTPTPMKTATASVPTQAPTPTPPPATAVPTPVTAAPVKTAKPTKPPATSPTAFRPNEL